MINTILLAVILTVGILSAPFIPADAKISISAPVSSELTDDQAGYDQAAYDACMDSADTTTEQCE